jgi:hypothetical protein
VNVHDRLGRILTGFESRQLALTYTIRHFITFVRRVTEVLATVMGDNFQ